MDDLGLRLRLRRKVRRMALANMSAATGISIAQLSQIERGNAMPSIDKLVLRCQALHMPLSWLLDPDGSDGRRETGQHVIRRSDHRHISFPQSGMEKDRLTPESMLKVQMMRNVLHPDGTTGAELYKEPEGAKCGLALRGVLGLEINGVQHTLNAGDSFALDTTSLIRFWVNGTETEVIWVTPRLLSMPVCNPVGTTVFARAQKFRWPLSVHRLFGNSIFMIATRRPADAGHMSLAT